MTQVSFEEQLTSIDLSRAQEEFDSSDDGTAPAAGSAGGRVNASNPSGRLVDLVGCSNGPGARPDCNRCGRCRLNNSAFDRANGD
jgi:hypothetical protein